eukprot:NODE_4229_length_842_cov_5.274905_g3903_i0.p1 GENE.NODE_4229_length_842_cov_5.274905_g3903_i0~~NODE_4229_length_842_cov_5.274905_g3903_i0.p1  ORF type:complete len:223 (+),score=50.79 NODE_4229_length_842_cov_5.274905_g3903_i0:106-774(+)
MSTSKDKKLKRKQQLQAEKEDTEFIKKASSLEDPIAMFEPFRLFKKVDPPLCIRHFAAEDLSRAHADWCFGLLKTFMQPFYEKCEAMGGWNERFKREELLDPSARFLLALEGEKPFGYLCFRFDMDCGRRVLYCYELHVAVEMQRKGLGKHLMVLLELIGRKLEFEYVVLTLFVDNAGAQNFYRKTLKYTTDSSSPPNTLDDVAGYEILSKPLCPRAGSSNG